MEGTIGEIRLFGGNFAPRNWAFCQGQLLAINSNTALFSILGVVYGGDGRTTFGLPDLRSRVAMGNQQGPGLSPRFLGEVLGSENVTLINPEMPVHNHVAIAQPGSGTPTGTAVLNGVNGVGGEANPGGNYLGQDTNGSSHYVSDGGTDAMNASSISITNVNAPLPNVALAITGGNQPHNNLQPVLALNFVICTVGIFPSRN